ncbi:hypothetical protein HOF56_05055 [Candidatus Peribacteria bacterium]|jgi:hypothetical protein|nr:hypothetical protein [Candidatus Peribacteria bacterium]MBT4021118.1 hypothetical protein [Candidatus Peribacteria bacterium]MBT4240652.1 hypothetical protein [Candidatus Peribacteria bacterium]MBT4473748.1 hypothetical protein [Candidatus Peribacteria bacterium]
MTTTRAERTDRTPEKRDSADPQLPDLLKLRASLREEIARLDKDIRKVEGRRR